MFKTLELFVPNVPKTFRVGDVAISQIFLEFSDGTFHQPGQRIRVTYGNLDYMNIMHTKYTKA